MNNKIKLITSNSEFESLEQVWNELLLQSPANNYFLTWEWLWNWWQVYALSDDKLAIIVMENQDGIVGIAPLFIRKVRLARVLEVRRLMYLGTQPSGHGEAGSDYMNIVYREGEEEIIVESLFRIIDQYDLCDEMSLSKMDISAKTFELVRQEAFRRDYLVMVPEHYESPYISLPERWEDYLNSLSPSMRARIRNQRRRIETDSNARLVRVERKEDIEHAFEELARLNSSRWGEQAAFSFQEFQQFHKKIMPSMFNNGRLKLSVLSINGSAKAAVYNIVYKNKIYGYQSGTDISDGKTSFGYALKSYCIEEAIEEGLSEYDFLHKSHLDAYKDRFARDYRRIADLYVVCSRRLKPFIKVREFARSAYHQLKPQHKPVGAMKAS